MKRKTAKEILADSFREIAGENRINKITIKDIADNCGYSSATFYRHFKDKYDLIAWDYARKMEELMQAVQERPYQDVLLRAAEYFEAQKQYMANLFLHTSGFDSFIIYMTEANFHLLSDYILSQSKVKSLDTHMTSCVRFFCLGVSVFICEWILGKVQGSPTDIAQIFADSVPAPLRPYLLKE